MSAFADAAKAVERGDAEGGGEVSVGTSANGGFVELPADFLRDGLRFLVESGDAFGALHRKTVDAAFNVELAEFVERFQSSQLAIESFCLLHFFDADVDLDAGFGGDDVGARASANHSRIHRDAVAKIVQL